MDQAQQIAGDETHPLFPSGEWEGFYTYATGPGAAKHTMQLMLHFKDTIVTGSGSDDIGRFSWKGTYHTRQLECLMTKYYYTHRVYYTGQVDENGIWGTWQLYGIRGGFHIWPKKSLENQEVMELAVQEVSSRQDEYIRLVTK